MDKKSSKLTSVIVIFSITTIVLIVLVSTIVTIVLNKQSIENNSSNTNELATNNIENEITNILTEITNEINKDNKNLNENTEENTESNLNNNEENAVIEVESNTSINTNDEETDTSEIPDSNEELKILTTEGLLPEAYQLKNEYSSSIQAVLEYTNQYREEANADEEDDVSNRSDLVLDSELTTAACIRALELAYSDSFSHERPDGRNCFSVLNDLGIGSMARAENISESYSAKSTAEAWKNSSSHYKNMINPRFTKVGIGVANYNGSNYWVQIFTD